jgi:ATP-dependent Clp protease adaptor protein ClpS
MPQTKTKTKKDTRQQVKRKKPDLWRVILLNDHFTSFEFVIHVLLTVFHKSMDEAHNLTLQIHHQGKGVCGTYTYEIAETKRSEVLRLAKQEQFPLQCKLVRECE